MYKRFALPERGNIIGSCRAMKSKDAASVLKLYNKQMESKKIKYKMSQEEILHYLVPRDGILWTWVIENEVEGKLQVTDFFSMHRVGQACFTHGKYT